MLVFSSKVKRCQRVPATMFRQEELLRQAVSTPVPRSTRDVWAVSTFQKLGGILHHKAEHHHHFGSYEFYRPPIRLKHSEAVGAHWSYALDTACPRPTNPSCKIGCYASSISRSTRSLAYSIPCLLASAPHDISQSQTDLYRSILISNDRRPSQRIIMLGLHKRTCSTPLNSCSVSSFGFSAQANKRNDQSYNSSDLLENRIARPLFFDPFAFEYDVNPVIYAPYLNDDSEHPGFRHVEDVPSFPSAEHIEYPEDGDLTIDNVRLAPALSEGLLNTQIDASSLTISNSMASTTSHTTITPPIDRATPASPVSYDSSSTTSGSTANLLCGACNLLFSRQCDFKCVPLEASYCCHPLNHNSTHMNRKHIRRYECDIIGCTQQPFNLRTDLNRHKQKHGTSQVFACTQPTCRRTFTRKDNMLKHRKRQH